MKPVKSLGKVVAPAVINMGGLIPRTGARAKASFPTVFPGRSETTRRLSAKAAPLMDHKMEKIFSWFILLAFSFLFLITRHYGARASIAPLLLLTPGIVLTVLTFFVYDAFIVNPPLRRKGSRAKKKAW